MSIYKNMNKIIAVFILLLSLVIGCKNDKSTLYLYNWTDYIDPSIIQQFEKDNNCIVKVDSYDSNEEMYAKLLNSNNNVGYDIIFPSSYQIPLLVEKGYLEKLNKDKLKNFFDNYDKTYNCIVLDTNMTYSVSYSLSFIGLAYNTNKVKKVEKYADLTNGVARVCLLRDMRQILGAALKSIGFSANSTNNNEIEQATQIVCQWKKHVVNFNDDDYKRGIADETYYVVQGYNNDIAMAINGLDHIKFILPKDGYTASSDEIAILSNSRNKDLAYKFINFLYDPMISARNIEYILGSMPNKNAKKYVKEELKNDKFIFPSQEMCKKSEVIKDLGQYNILYYKAWDKIIK